MAGLAVPGSRALAAVVAGPHRVGSARVAVRPGAAAGPCDRRTARRRRFRCRGGAGVVAAAPGRGRHGGGVPAAVRGGGHLRVRHALFSEQPAARRFRADSRRIAGMVRRMADVSLAIETGASDLRSVTTNDTRDTKEEFIWFLSV